MGPGTTLDAMKDTACNDSAIIEAFGDALVLAQDRVAAATAIGTMKAFYQGLKGKVVSSIVASNAAFAMAVLEDNDALDSTMDELDDQISKLCNLAYVDSKDMWQRLLAKCGKATEAELVALIGIEASDRVNIACLMNYMAWIETPGAVELLREKLLHSHDPSSADYKGKACK